MRCDIWEVFSAMVAVVLRPRQSSRGIWRECGEGLCVRIGWFFFLRREAETAAGHVVFQVARTARPGSSVETLAHINRKVS